LNNLVIDPRSNLQFAFFNLQFSLYLRCRLRRLRLGALSQALLPEPDLQLPLRVEIKGPRAPIDRGQ
jgi:hypothetical protein